MRTAMTRWAVMIVALCGSVTLAQIPAGQKVGLVRYLQAGYAGIKSSLLAAAEQMPEADYEFKPSQMAEARTYGAVIGHAADGMFAACATARGLENPAASAEKTLRSKPELMKVLTDAIAFCDVAFSTLTEATSAEYVRQGQGEVARAAVLSGLLAHNAEMFGISTVYLRAKNLVPPGSR